MEVHMGRTPRKFSAEFKAKVVIDILANGKSLGQASREYGIKDAVLSRWKQEFLERAPALFENGSAVDDRERQIDELERMVGRLTMQLEMAKKVSSYLGSRQGESEK
jgi:transposase-like protein